MDTKIIAFYLPQFHTIPENDLWWGKDFTEWVNVKKAVPMFMGHNQPRIPVDGNYYNLLDLKTQEWQAKIAKDHGIGGFCYYHYWFEGDQLLEKPAENMIKNPSIDIPFCFSWANHNWTRTWGGPGKNEMLKKQTYGDHESWVKHFEYLLPFFQDQRYILIDKKPVFIIYNSSDIKDIDLMMDCWNSIAIKNGFKGIHLIETINSYQKDSIAKLSQGVIQFEPLYTFQHELSFYHKVILSINKLTELLFRYTVFCIKFNYDDIWKKILSRKGLNRKVKTYYCGFVDWDNSPRKGKRGYIAVGANPNKFEKYMFQLINKSEKEGTNNMVFVNAWNEWAEGTYLEPDQKYEFSYLNKIKALTGK